MKWGYEAVIRSVKSYHDVAKSKKRRNDEEEKKKKESIGVRIENVVTESNRYYQKICRHPLPRHHLLPPANSGGA